MMRKIRPAIWTFVAALSSVAIGCSEAEKPASDESGKHSETLVARIFASETSNPAQRPTLTVTYE